jgi:hypothetical protein
VKVVVGAMVRVPFSRCTVVATLTFSPLIEAMTSWAFGDWPGVAPRLIGVFSIIETCDSRNARAEDVVRREKTN